MYLFTTVLLPVVVMKFVVEDFEGGSVDEVDEAITDVTLVLY